MERRHRFLRKKGKEVPRKKLQSSLEEQTVPTGKESFHATFENVKKLKTKASHLKRCVGCTRAKSTREKKKKLYRKEM